MLFLDLKENWKKLETPGFLKYMKVLKDASKHNEIEQAEICMIRLNHIKIWLIGRTHIFTYRAFTLRFLLI